MKIYFFFSLHNLRSIITHSLTHNTNPIYIYLSLYILYIIIYNTRWLSDPVKSCNPLFVRVGAIIFSRKFHKSNISYFSHFREIFFCCENSKKNIFVSTHPSLCTYLLPPPPFHSPSLVSPTLPFPPPLSPHPFPSILF